MWQGEDGGSMFLWNAGIPPHHYMASCGMSHHCEHLTSCIMIASFSFNLLVEINGHFLYQATIVIVSKTQCDGFKILVTDKSSSSSSSLFKD
jgi:hypothetical protein